MAILRSDRGVSVATMRPIELADIPAIHELMRAGEIADRTPIATSLEEVAEMFDEPFFDPINGACVVETGNQIVGWGRIWHEPSGERLERAYLIGDIHPDHRRRGIGTEMFAWQHEKAALLLGAYAHDLPRFVRASAYDWQADRLTLFERHSMAPVRWAEALVRPLDPLPDAMAPDGITVESWDSRHTEEVRQVANASFADHWGTTPQSPEGWRSRISGHGTRLDLSQIALARDRVVGYSINNHYPEDEAVTGRRDGWIGHLGVLREWRKRGVASALIRGSLAAFLRAGLTHAMLDVDADNPSGASRLYRSLGFEVVHSVITYELEVPRL